MQQDEAGTTGTVHPPISGINLAANFPKEVPIKVQNSELQICSIRNICSLQLATVPPMLLIMT
jgi:hypothetical protein